MILRASSAAPVSATGPTDDAPGLSEETASIILPDADVAGIFARRAARLRALAEGHAMKDFLEFAAALCEAQKTAGAPRPTYLAILQTILAAMEPVPMPEPSRSALVRLKSAAGEELDSLAQSIYDGNLQQGDLAAASFLGAALQAHWTLQASRLQPGEARRHAEGCPVCGSVPVAGVVQSGRSLRYLHCSLCGAQWHVPRLTCASCGATDELSYFVIQNTEGGGNNAKGVKAEACGRCHGYLKLFYHEENPGAEPVADDLATFALDLLTAQQGYSRIGRNFFLLEM